MWKSDEISLDSQPDQIEVRPFAYILVFWGICSSLLVSSNDILFRLIERKQEAREVETRQEGDNNLGGEGAKVHIPLMGAGKYLIFQPIFHREAFSWQPLAPDIRESRKPVMLLNHTFSLILDHYLQPNAP